jgi:hypothetical protein
VNSALNVFYKAFRALFILAAVTGKTPEEDTMSEEMWYNTLHWLESAPENPVDFQLDEVLQIAKTHDHWIVRDAVVTLLGRMQYKPEELAAIAQTDKHSSVRLNAHLWLIDYDGQLLKLRLEHDTSNPFGQGWDVLKTPVRAVVAAIDDDKHSLEIGLSAMQMRNLNLEGRVVGPVVGVAYRGKELAVIAYNAFGNSAIGGAGIRVSTALARELGLELGVEVELS